MTAVLPQSDPWLERAIAVIRAGGIVALPYERLFGLAADAFDPHAVAKVAAIKGRPTHAIGPHPIAVILPHRKAAEQVAELSPLALRLMDAYWPGLLTLVAPEASGLPGPLISESGKVGLRLPGPCPAAELAAATGCVLTATSANRAGAMDATTHEEVLGLTGIDLIIEGAVLGAPGSTVVDVSGTVPVVLRQGAVVIDEEVWRCR